MLQRSTINKLYKDDRKVGWRTAGLHKNDWLMCRLEGSRRRVAGWLINTLMINRLGNLIFVVLVLLISI